MDLLIVLVIAAAAWVALTVVVVSLCSAAGRADESTERLHARMTPLSNR